MCKYIRTLASVLGFFPIAVAEHQLGASWLVLAVFIVGLVLITGAH